ncbi:MAG: hypothetical protein WB611_25130 [Stellaceae bacterium]
MEETQAPRLRRLRRLLGDLAGLADDETLGAAELRARLKRLIAPFEPERQRQACPASVGAVAEIPALTTIDDCH